MALTAIQARNAKPGRHADGKGLYLLVKPSGARSWVLRVQFKGRRRDYGLGSFIAERKVPSPVPLEQRRELTLGEARDKAAAARSLAKAGLDPSQEWSRVETVTPTFAEAARKYHAAVKGGWKNGKHGDQWINTLETYAFPSLGERSVAEIDAPAIQSALLPIWLAIPETSRRVRQRIAAVLDFAKGQGWRETEAPVRAVNSLMKGIRQPKRGNFQAMPYSELPALMAQLRNMEASVGRKGLEFLILTAARSGEVRGAVWDEINWEAAQSDIPGARMKAGEPHSVALSEAALSVLREVEGLVTGRKGEPIFPGLKGKPMSGATLAKALRVAGGGSYTVHGMRSAFRDWAAEQTNFPGEWAEAALAHVLPNKVEAAYRRTKFLEQRRKLMEAWGVYCTGGGANVVRLAAAQ